MGKLVAGAVLVAVAFSMLLAAAAVRSQRPGPVVNLLRFVGYAAAAIGVAIGVGSLIVVIDPGEVGVRHAFGYVDPAPLLAGIRFVPPWSSIERYSIREGVRDGIVQYSINHISKRTQIANTLESLMDSSLETTPRAGGGKFRIATVTAFFLRDLQPPAQVVQAINNKIAQEQQIEAERHRVEVARLQTEQQRLLNQTLSPEALTKQWIEVLHDMKGSNNLIIFVPTEGGLPLLNIGDLRKNLKP